MELFHGKLHIHIIEARNLPVISRIKKDDVPDPYVRGFFDNVKLFKTKFIVDNMNPIWDKRFDIPVKQEAHSLILEVLDKNKYHVDGTIGKLLIEAKELKSGVSKIAYTSIDT